MPDTNKKILPFMFVFSLSLPIISKLIAII